MFSSRQGLIVALLAAVSLAACSGGSSPVPFQATQAVAPTNLLLPDAAAPPSCKGQKKTKDYAKGLAQKLSTSGGTLCVPSFKGWGGSISYAGTTTAGYTMSLISSTTAYSGGYWPPDEPGAAIFYIQFGANGSARFNTKPPKGGELASAQLKVNRPYTVNATLDIGGSLWQSLGECYTKAAKGKYGPYITGVGTVFGGGFFLGTQGVIEIIPGKFTTAKCK